MSGQSLLRGLLISLLLCVVWGRRSFGGPEKHYHYGVLSIGDPIPGHQGHMAHLFVLGNMRSIYSVVNARLIRSWVDECITPS